MHISSSHGGAAAAGLMVIMMVTLFLSLILFQHGCNYLIINMTNKSNMMLLAQLKAHRKLLILHANSFTPFDSLVSSRSSSAYNYKAMDDQRRRKLRRSRRPRNTSTTSMMRAKARGDLQPDPVGGGNDIDPRYGVEKRLVPTGPNPLHH